MDPIKIAFVGDIFPGGVLHGTNRPCITQEVYDYLQSFDVRVGTLECAIGDNLAFDEDKMRHWGNIIYAKGEDTRRLREIGIDIVSLANNHVTDLGAAGLLNTMSLLDTAGIWHFGAGGCLRDAEEPAVVSIRGKKIAFLACYDTSVAPHPASEHAPGVCTSSRLIDNIGKAKGLYDYVFVLPHWGCENSHRPMPKDRGFGHALIRAGADGVIGSHTHRVQPFVVFRGKPIFFSLGSFLFPDFYQQPPCPVWYPGPSEDLRDIPVVNRYTCSHRQRVKFVWPQASRIGAIAEVRIGARITAGYRLTYLTDDNKVTFLADTKRYVRMLSCLGLAVRSPFYSSMFLLSECCLYLMRRLARNGERGHRSCLAD